MPASDCVSHGSEGYIAIAPSLTPEQVRGITAHGTASVNFATSVKAFHDSLRRSPLQSLRSSTAKQRDKAEAANATQ